MAILCAQSATGCSASRGSPRASWDRSSRSRSAWCRRRPRAGTSPSCCTKRPWRGPWFTCTASSSSARCPRRWRRTASPRDARAAHRRARAHGQAGRDARAEHGFRVAGSVDVDTADRPELWPAADVAIDFSIGEAVPVNLPRLAARGTPWSSARRAGRRTKPAARTGRRSGIGVVAAPNFAIGVNLFVALVERAAGLWQDQPAFGAWLHELHHAAKRDAPSGTALASRRRCAAAGTPSAAHLVDAGRGDSRNAHGGLRRRRRNDHADSHRAGSDGVRARGAPGGGVGARAVGVVHHAGCARARGLTGYGQRATCDGLRATCCVRRATCEGSRAGRATCARAACSRAAISGSS
jgi:dihydrodipicolinate reductase